MDEYRWRSENETRNLLWDMPNMTCLKVIQMEPKPTLGVQKEVSIQRDMMS